MSKNFIISPSIMCSTPSNMEAYIREFEKVGIDTIHFDVMDGRYVPNVMLGVRDYQAIKSLTKLPVDIHMMCTEPDAYINIFKPQPGDWVSIHPETTYHPYRTLQNIQALGCKAGIVLNPGYPIECIRDMASVLDFVMIMAVNPGFAGQKMVPDHLDKLRRIRELIDSTGKEILITIDGNTTIDNAREMLKAGANGLITGTSSMMKHGPEGFEEGYTTYVNALMKV